MRFPHGLDPVQGYGNLLSLVGGFFTNGTSDPVATTVNGGFFTVVHTATGVYTATFKDLLNLPVGIFPSLQMATPDGSKAVAGAWTAASGATPPTLVIQTRNASDTLFDLAAAASNYVSLELLFKMTSAPRP